MSSHFQRRLIFSLLPVALCACGTIQPQGALKAIVKGEHSEAAQKSPEDVKNVEDNLRQVNRQTPIPKEKKGALGFKIPF